MNTLNQVSEIKKARELAKLFNSDQILKCTDDQIETRSNGCGITGKNIDIVNTLARAGVIRQLTDSGSSFQQAMRELGRRMRSI